MKNSMEWKEEALHQKGMADFWEATARRYAHDLSHEKEKRIDLEYQEVRRMMELQEYRASLEEAAKKLHRRYVIGIAAASGLYLLGLAVIYTICIH